VTISDLHATIFTAMGINPKTGFEVERRPIYATEIGQTIAGASAGTPRLKSHRASTKVATLTRYFSD
jgi:hypothetical protein